LCLDLKNNFNKNKPDRSGNTFFGYYDKDCHVVPPRNDDKGRNGRSLKKIATNSRTTETDEKLKLLF